MLLIEVRSCSVPKISATIQVIVTKFYRALLFPTIAR